MTRGLSIYLDLLRLVAAIEVFVFHLGGFTALGVPQGLWNSYGHEAVTIFFVLSGFVIRHAAGTRDSTFQEFAISRLTRVYSVALPCLVLTFLFDRIGHQIDPNMYSGLTPHGSSLLRLGIGAGMLNEAWVSVQILSNTPYWSISYEFWYYFIFAGFFYFSGRSRWLVVIGCAAIAGPKILLLFPIWLMGCAAYNERVSARFPIWLSLILFLQPVAALAAFDHWHLASSGAGILQQFMGHDVWREYLSWSRYVLSDTILGVSVALHLVGAKAIAPHLMGAIGRAERPIRYLAGKSFTLYLLHQPTMLLVGACLLTLPHQFRGAVVALTTLSILAIVSSLTEGQRHRLRPLVDFVVARMHRMLRSRLGYGNTVGQYEQ